MKATCSLPSELTIYTIAELYPLCLSWISPVAHADADAAGPAAADGLRVDAQAVLEVDAAGVQLLLSLSNTLAQHERQLQLVSPSAPLVAACTALGASGLVAHAELTGEAL